MLIVYDPSSHKYRGYERYARPWCYGPAFDECFGDRTDPGLCSWVVPGTWPWWML